MTVAALIQTLKGIGVSLSAVDGRLRVDAPAGVVDASHLAALREHKPAILAYLSASNTLAEVLSLVEQAKAITPFAFLDDLAHLARGYFERGEYDLLTDAGRTAKRVLANLQSRPARRTGSV